jgi:protein-S-isoprenylcysteine O-methyltransferase Ste14
MSRYRYPTDPPTGKAERRSRPLSDPAAAADGKREYLAGREAEMRAIEGSASASGRSLLRGRRASGLLLDGLLLAVWVSFAYFHVHRAVVDHVYTAVPFAVENMVLAGLALLRRPSRTTSARPGDWLVAMGGAWLPLGLRPGPSGADLWAILGTSVQLAGVCSMVVSYAFLGRSFGIVAANRGLKVKGPYALVRHPVYAGHIVVLLGFIIANYRPLNLLIAAVVVACQLLRIQAEERVLRGTGDYRAYQARVRWRLLPGLY